MAASCVRFREVLQSQLFPLRWREISISSGGHPGSLHDLKLPDAAGGYAYVDHGRSSVFTRNRFIYWRTHKDILELVEQSLDFNLTGNCVRFCFRDAPILNGIEICEAHGHIFILVATASSVHQIDFRHPNKLHQHDSVFIQGPDHGLPSIFSDASVGSLQDPHSSYNINQAGGTVYQVHTATAWLTNEGEPLFALGTHSGSILLVRLPARGLRGVPTIQELRQSSMMHRLWTGLVPGVLRGRQTASDTSLSMVIHPLGQNTFIFSVCQDHKLRMWSCKSYDCVLVTDLLEHMPDGMEPHKLAIGGEGHVIKKSLGSNNQSVQLAVYLSFCDRSQFCVFEPVLADGRYQLNHITTIFSLNDDLMDFTLTSTHLWTLWTNKDGEPIAKAAPISSHRTGVESWLPVFMESREGGEVAIPDNKEPRESYMDHIFHPGRFSTQAILKALNIYRRSVDNSFVGEMDMPIEVLKMQVSATVEHVIQSAASEYEMAEEEYYQLQIQQWSKFHSCCVQYQEVGNKAIGIFADNSSGLVSLVMKNNASFIRPCHVLEYLHLAPADMCAVEDFEGNPFIEDEEAGRDVIELYECMKIVEDCLTGEMIYAFEQDLYHTQAPEFVAQQVVNALLTTTRSGEHDVGATIQNLIQNIQTIKDVVRAADIILQILDLSQGQTDGLLTDELALDPSRELACSHLFASETAVDALVRMVTQLVESRFDTSRNMLILLMLMINTGERGNLALGVTEQIRSKLTSRASEMVHTYFLMRWCCHTVASQIPASIAESNLRQIEALNISECAPKNETSRLDGHCMSLLELFLHGQGGLQTRLMLAQSNLFEDESCGLWSHALLPTIITVAQLIWPLSPTYLFPEFLMYQCQYLQLQEYVRLAHVWCDWNSSSNKFMLGQSYLNTSEPYKALDAFLEAVHGVATEDFLQRLLKPEEQNIQHLEVLYYLKVVQLFEQFSLPHLVVSLATTAIDIAAEDDPNLPTLWLKVFKHQLELGHNDEAYAAMISNPDPSGRKDCLRQFLVVLCERGQLQQLVEFPYIDLHDEVVSIMESRARAVDLISHNFYDLLYAFHIFRGNYRKAGSVMYECGMRLGKELPGLKGLQRQAKCYLATLNALRLVDPNYAWIVKPTPTAKQRDMAASSKKRLVNGDDKEEDMLECHLEPWEVLEIDEIQKEHMLVDSRLQLLQKDPDPAHMVGPTSSAEETVSLLISRGLFDGAIPICQQFDMPLTPIFKGLAYRCVNLAKNSNKFMQGDNDYTAQAWDWLEENDLGTQSSSSDTSSTDQAWRLIQSYLCKYDSNSTRYHRCVAQQLLTHAFVLPTWFITSYKRLNPAELLRLYLDFDLLEEAAHMCLEYIDAVLGKGTEYYGLTSYLRYGAPSVWLPYTCIDQLLLALKDVATDPVYGELHMKLEDKLDKYFSQVEAVSADVINASHRFPGSQSFLQ